MLGISRKGFVMKDKKVPAGRDPLWGQCQVGSLTGAVHLPNGNTCPKASSGRTETSRGAEGQKLA